jgi:cation diffusion facilitator CzcD-associated flavoprotein CzcO
LIEEEFVKKYRVAVVGAGAVGVEMIRVLKNRKFPLEELRVLARTERPLVVDGATYHVRSRRPRRSMASTWRLFAGTEGEKGGRRDVRQRSHCPGGGGHR